MRILIADDDVVSLRLLEHTLERMGHDVLAVADGTCATSALLEPDGPRFAILDWMMPGADGLTVCHSVRLGASHYVYVILLTARDRHEDMVEGLDAGADDFLTKPFSAVELRARLRSGARVLELQAGLLEAQEKLRTEATRDDLTGLWNRRAILEHFRREVHRARHERRPLTIVMADLDSFKQVNDTYGHAAGDAVLKQAAEQMRSQMRGYDFIGRYGGEEFLLVLPGCDAVTGRAVAERVRSHVEASPASLGAMVLPVTVSLGLTWTCSPDAEADAMLQLADEALYEAKAQGRNCVVEKLACTTSVT